MSSRHGYRPEEDTDSRLSVKLSSAAIKCHPARVRVENVRGRNCPKTCLSRSGALGAGGESVDEREGGPYALRETGADWEVGSCRNVVRELRAPLAHDPPILEHDLPLSPAREKRPCSDDDV